MSGAKVQGLRGVGLQVPDLDVAERFYTTFGLAARREAGRLGLRCPGRAQDEITVVAGPDKRMLFVSFFVPPGSEGTFADRVTAAGLSIQTPPAAWGLARGLSFQDPWGTWIHLDPVRPEPVPVQPLPPHNFGGRAERVDVHLWQQLEQEKTRPPLRIGHMLMFTPDFARAEAFFCDVLGFRTADRATGKVAFMAAGDGLTDHHCFGLINSTHRGFQHASFQVATLDDIGYGAWRMNQAGYKDGFGVGRHAIASNLFHYTRDPWGSWIEYYADMDKITDGWVCRDWNALPYIWGPAWSPEFWGKEMNGNFEPR